MIEIIFVINFQWMFCISSVFNCMGHRNIKLTKNWRILLHVVRIGSWNWVIFGVMSNELATQLNEKKSMADSWTIVLRHVSAEEVDIVFVQVKLGFRTPIVRGIPDFKDQDFGFRKQNFLRFRGDADYVCGWSVRVQDGRCSWQQFFKYFPADIPKKLEINNPRTDEIRMSKSKSRLPSWTYS